MKTSKLSKVQKELVSRIEESIERTGYGCTVYSDETRTVNVLLEKKIIYLIDSPFCVGNKIMQLVK